MDPHRYVARVSIYLWCKTCEVLEVAADAIGFLDDGMEVELGDLLNEAVVISLPVLQH